MIVLKMIKITFYITIRYDTFANPKKIILSDRYWSLDLIYDIRKHCASKTEILPLPPVARVGLHTLQASSVRCPVILT